MMGKVREDDRSRDEYLARASIVFVLAIQSMPVQYGAKLFRKGEELVSVPAVH